MKEHLKHLAAVFRTLQESEQKAHPGKCVFGVESIDFLGHRILADSVQQDKLADVRDLPSPIYVSSLCLAL